MLKKILSYSLLLTIANQLPMLVSLFTLPIVSQYLTKADYGIYGTLFSYVGLLSAFKDWGLVTVFGNTYFKYPNRFQWIWGKLMGFVMTWALLYAMLLAVFLYFIFLQKIEGLNVTYILFLIVIPTALFENTRSLGIRLLQFQHKILPVFVVSVLTAVIGALVNIHTITQLHWKGYESWFLVYFLTSFLNFLFYSWVLHFKFKVIPNLKFTYKWLRKHLNVAIPTIPHFYSNYILKSLDRPLMDKFHIPLADIGLYNVAYNFGNYVESAQMAVNQVLSPFYFNLFKQKEENIEQKIRLLTFLWQGTTLFGAFVLCIWLKEIFGFLYRKNPEFAMVYMYSIPIVMSFTYRPMYVSVVDRVIFNEKTKSVLLISLVAAIISIVLNLTLIPFLGFQGPIITVFITFMYMGFSGFFWKSMNKYIKLPFYPLLWLGLIILTGGIAFLLKDIYWGYKLFISLGLLIIYGTILKEIHPELNRILQIK
ncbi:MAG: lipopolysaccharide biosynthesis protein [Bacteroidia bacterium]